jgi:hypothetical protein
VVFYSMATSSAEDVPRTLDFLFSRNRLNVAVSRARCLACIVASPRLLESRARTIEQMRLIDALCRFVGGGGGAGWLTRGEEWRERLDKSNYRVGNDPSCRRQACLAEDCCDQCLHRRIGQRPPLKPDIEGDRARDHEPQRGVRLVLRAEREVAGHFQAGDSHRCRKDSERDRLTPSLALRQARVRTARGLSGVERLGLRRRP